MPHAAVSDVEPTAVLAILRRPLPAETPDGAPLRVEDLVGHLASARDPRRALALLE